MFAGLVPSKDTRKAAPPPPPQLLAGLAEPGPPWHVVTLLQSLPLSSRVLPSVCVSMSNLPFLLFVFLGPHLRHMEVLRLGI